MTNGTSQGLFVVIAIIIFGIFIFISYLLFRDTLKPSLGGIFTDGLEQANCSFNGENPLNEICNPTYNGSLSKMNKDFTFSILMKSQDKQNVYFGSSFINFDNHNVTQTINLQDLVNTDRKPVINGEEISIVSMGVGFEGNELFKNKFPDKNFDRYKNIEVSNNITNSEAMFGNGGLLGYYSLGFISFDGVGGVSGNIIEKKILKLKIGQINEIKIVATNNYGGKSIFNYKIKVING